MQRFFWFSIGMLVSALLFRGATPVEAQVEPGRTIYGRYSGAAKALTATTDGYLNVVLH